MRTELRAEKLFNYPKCSAPSRKGEYFYFSKNDGLQNQKVLYRQKGLSGEPQVVIDPNKLSPDGTSRMTTFALSKDGAHAVYGVSKGGSDWEEYFVMEMATKKSMSDHLEWVKVSGVARSLLQGRAQLGRATWRPALCDPIGANGSSTLTAGAH